MHGIVTDMTVFAVDDYALEVMIVSIRSARLFHMMALTLRPVCATICAARKDGSPKKVIIGFEPARRALSRRSCGLCSALVVTKELVMVGGGEIEDILVFAVHFSGATISEDEAMRAKMAAAHSPKYAILLAFGHLVLLDLVSFHQHRSHCYVYFRIVK